MSYGTVAGVAARVPGLSIDAISTPDAEQIAVWLAQGSAVIDRTLGAAGVSVPVAPATILASELAALAEQYAAAQSLRARGLDSLTGEGEARSDVWLREFRAALVQLGASDLTAVGATAAPAVVARPSRLRSLQLRRIDGYSATYEGTPYPYQAPGE